MMIPTFIILLFGLVFTFVPEAVLRGGFEGFTGQSWSALSPETMDWIILASGRMFGVHVLIIAILLFAITLKGFRMGERWSWYAILITVTLGMSFDSVAVYMMGELPVVAIDLIMLLITYIALGISAKDILSKKQ
jgi:hypothetical protein